MIIKSFLLAKLMLNSGAFFSQLFSLDWYSNPLRIWIEGLGVNKSHDVIEIGCGSGELSLWVSDFSNHVTGVDKDIEKITRARRASSRSNIDFKQVDLVCSQMYGRKYDYCIGASILNVVPDTLSFMKNIEKFCKPGAVVSFIQPSPGMTAAAVNTYLSKHKLGKVEQESLRLWASLAKKVQPEEVKSILIELEFDKIEINYFFESMLFSISGTKN